MTSYKPRRSIEILAGFKAFFSSNKAALLFFLLTLLLVYPALFVSSKDINPWDEAAYLHSGQILLDQGIWPNLGGSPLMALFYAILYLFFRGSPFWMAETATLGRFVLFGLIWLSAYLVAKRLESYASPFLVMGFLLVAPLSILILQYPSDPLFTALAGLSFWQFLGFYQERDARHLVWASLFMALSAMARNDGLILFVILLALTVLFSLKEKRWWIDLPAVILPFALLSGGYVLVYGLLTGNFSPGTFERTYDNFESGQGIVFHGQDNTLAPIYQGQLEARRIFGTPEENHYSIFIAIRRNPRAYLERLIAFTKTLPDQILNAYGLRFTLLFALFAIRGLVEFWRKRRFGLAAIFLLWPLHLTSAFAITLVREGHLMFVFYVVFALAAIGLWSFVMNLEDRRETFTWAVVLSSLSLAALLLNKLAIFYGASLVLCGLLAAYWIQKWMPGRQNWLGLVLFVFLCLGIVLHGNYPSPIIPHYGTDAYDQAILYLQLHYPAGTPVAAIAPGPTWMAKMTFTGLGSLDTPKDKNSDEFLQWMHDQKIRAIFVDNILSSGNPYIWGLLQPQIGHGLRLVYTGDQGDIQVLALAP